jgi:hypothetical protein
MSVTPESTSVPLASGGELEHPPKANTIATVENAMSTFMRPSLEISTLHT